MLFLFKISQEKNTDYDTYDSAVVVSRSPETARLIHPAADSHTGEPMNIYVEDEGWYSSCGLRGNDGWADPSDVEVTCVGVAADGLVEGQIIISSFNAG